MMSAEEIVQGILDTAIDQDEDSDGGYHDYILSDTAPRIVAALIAAGYICHDVLEVDQMCSRCGTIRGHG